MKLFNREVHFLGEQYVVSPGGTQVRVITRSPIDNGTTNKFVTKAQGNTVPADGESGFARGCEFVQLDGVFATTMYRNLGSETSSKFRPVDTVLYEEVAITAAQMKALAATQKSLVAAPGAGYVLQLLSALFIYDYAAVFATVDATNGLQIKYTNDSGAAVTQVLPTNGVLDQTTDEMRTMSLVTTASVEPVANAALVLDNTHSSELTGTGSPCRMKIAYIIHATGL